MKHIFFDCLAVFAAGLVLGSLVGCEVRHGVRIDSTPANPCAGPLTPKSASDKAIRASMREAAEICAGIEAELTKRFDGVSYTTTFMVHHPYTAHYVGLWFGASWSVKWAGHNTDWSEWTMVLKPKAKPNPYDHPRDIPLIPYTPWPSPYRPRQAQ